ncbi:MAG: SUMF1/EgtB/PvdO family nonheme iron enzyme [Xanthobacteraceae bacterium]
MTIPELFLFVSHVSEDRSAAMAIVEELERRGVRCWIAPRDVRPGRPFDDEIADAIEASRAMLLIFSERCNASEYIRREVTVAGESQKVIIPFRIENAQPKHGLRVRLSDLHWIDGFASRERAIDELVKTFHPPNDEAVVKAAADKALREPTPSVIDKSGADEERRRLRRSEARPLWPPSRPALVAGSLIGLAVLGAINVWLAHAPPTPVPPPSPVAPAPVPVAPAPIPVTPVPVPVAPTQATDTPLSPERERALKSKDTFKECTNCPEMIVVPAGTFTMGSPASELGRNDKEAPQQLVTFARQFAVERFEVTFDEWDACVADGGCNGYRPNDAGWGRGRQPVINVSWNDAKAYVAWLSKKTSKPYRLLSEAEREYVTRAGTTTPFWWGNSISTSQANYNGDLTYGNGVKGEKRGRTVPVDSFAPNPWGLYQVHGNVWDRTEDCYHDSYQGVPADGSAWTSGDCNLRVVRGGSWYDNPASLRSANRGRNTTGFRSSNLGFRVGRTLLAP